MTGFLRFLLAVGLVILGLLGFGTAIVAVFGSTVVASASGNSPSFVMPWVIGIVSAIVLLGGVYMLRNKK